MTQTQGRRVLVVTAHPDDAEFHFGATIAMLAGGGADVSYIVCSDGGQGGESADDDGLTATRAAEQRAAASVLGVRQVTFLGLPDGRLVADLDLRQAITAELRRHRPSLVLTHFPRRVLDIPVEASHPDHIAVGEATLCAVYPDCGNPHAFPELARAGLAAHHVDEVWVPGYERPNHVVDATPFMDTKLAAIRCHASQLDGGPPDWVREWMRYIGRESGYEFAENFHRIKIG